MELSLPCSSLMMPGRPISCSQPIPCSQFGSPGKYIQEENGLPNPLINGSAGHHARYSVEWYDEKTNINDIFPDWVTNEHCLLFNEHSSAGRPPRLVRRGCSWGAPPTAQPPLHTAQPLLTVCSRLSASFILIKSITKYELVVNLNSF